MRLMPLFFVLLLAFPSPVFSQRTVTLYLDGARVESEERARNGYLEVSLPSSLIPGSLRVLPVGGGSVLKVEMAEFSDPAGRGKARRLAALKGKLEDRLRVLAVREETFRAAARSQGGKSPRKSKNNPDPLDTLRQGTEYALGELEGIYRARRLLEARLKEVEREASRGVAKRRSARVWLKGRGALVSYLTGTPRWVPSYSFRLEGEGRGELLLHARLPAPDRRARYLVAPGTVAGGARGKGNPGKLGVVYRLPLKLEKESYQETPYPSLSFTFSGGESWLPPGEAAGFWRGAYLGSAPFAGGEGGEIAFGR